jgi:hypothetical protein
LYYKRLKEKWGISSNFQLAIIFIVFGITGTLSVRVGKPILDFIKLNPESFESIPMGDIIYWTIRILIVFPIYQVILIIVGALFFQFSFFWSFEKKILKRIGFKRFFKDT